MYLAERTNADVSITAGNWPERSSRKEKKFQKT